MTTGKSKMWKLKDAAVENSLREILTGIYDCREVDLDTWNTDESSEFLENDLLKAIEQTCGRRKVKSNMVVECYSSYGSKDEETGLENQAEK